MQGYLWCWNARAESPAIDLQRFVFPPLVCLLGEFLILESLIYGKTDINLYLYCARLFAGDTLLHLGCHFAAGSGTMELWRKQISLNLCVCPFPAPAKLPVLTLGRLKWVESLTVTIHRRDVSFCCLLIIWTLLVSCFVNYASGFSTHKNSTPNSFDTVVIKTQCDISPPEMRRACLANLPVGAVPLYVFEIVLVDWCVRVVEKGTLVDQTVVPSLRPWL